MSVLCVAPRCHVPGWHAEACRSQKCQGCLPAVADHGLICNHCYERTEDALQEIPNLHALLDLQPGRGEPAPLGRAEAESRPPVRLDVLNELGPGAQHVHDEHRDQAGDLPAWYHLDRIVEDWASYTGEDDRLPAPTVPELCRWLTAHLDWAARHHPAIDEAIGELLDIRRRLRPLVNGVDLAEWSGTLPGRCQRCQRLSLVAEHGQAVCHHDTCRAVWVDESKPEVDAVVLVPLRVEPPTVEADGPVDLCKLTELPITMCAHCRVVVRSSVA